MMRQKSKKTCVRGRRSGARWGRDEDEVGVEPDRRAAADLDVALPQAALLRTVFAANKSSTPHHPETEHGGWHHRQRGQQRVLMQPSHCLAESLVDDVRAVEEGIGRYRP